MKWEDYKKAKEIAYVKEDLSYTLRDMIRLLNLGDDIVIVARCINDDCCDGTIISTDEEAKEILGACIDVHKNKIAELDKKFDEI